MEDNVKPATSSQSSTGETVELKWRRGNAKLRKNTLHLSIPAGHTCKPWATECFAYADKDTGKITDGEEQKFRCYASTMEAVYPSHRASLWNNFEALLGNIESVPKLHMMLYESVYPHVMEYVEEHESLPKIRMFGTSGDFFHENLYKACLHFARSMAPIRVYWYTKALPIWVKHIKYIPENLEQNASVGGRFDHLIHQHDLKYTRVVYNHEEAKQLKLPLDKRDELASEKGGPFAILLHGTQPKGSPASRALALLRKKGFRGYSKR